MSTINQAPEEIKQETATQPTPAPEKKTGTVKNQNALLRYITILFAVAFMIVLLSLVISTRQTQDTISALNATSASALENAEALQETNRQLSDDNAALQQQITALELELEDAEDELSQAQEAQTAAENTVKAYELLMTAIDARQNGDVTAFETAMTELEGLKDLLTGPALTRYQELERVW